MFSLVCTLCGCNRFYTHDYIILSIINNIFAAEQLNMVPGCHGDTIVTSYCTIVTSYCTIVTLDCHVSVKP